MSAPVGFAEMAARQGYSERLLYDISSVSHVTGVPARTLRAECQAGRLMHMLPPGRKQGIMCRPEWVDEWMREGTR